MFRTVFTPALTQHFAIANLALPVQHRFCLFNLSGVILAMIVQEKIKRIYESCLVSTSTIDFFTSVNVMVYKYKRDGERIQERTEEHIQ